MELTEGIGRMQLGDCKGRVCDELVGAGRVGKEVALGSGCRCRSVGSGRLLHQTGCGGLGECRRWIRRLSRCDVRL